MKYLKNTELFITSQKMKSTAALFFCFSFIIQLQTMPLLAQQTSSSKSSGTASALALLGTAAPISTALIVDDVTAGTILLSGGLVFGPILGYAYMDYPEIGMKFAKTRAIILGGTIGSIYLICSTGDCSWGLFGGDSGREFGFAVTLGLVGITATAILNLVDIANVGRRVKSHKQRLSVSPAYFHETQTLGLRANWKF